MYTHFELLIYSCVECDGNFDSNGNCLNGFALPDCCDCPPGRTEDNGVCSEFYNVHFEHRRQTLYT